MRNLFTIDLKDYSDTDFVYKRPSSRAIIIKNGKIALVYREKKNDYSFPKGHLEEGETPSQCAIREIYEESNVIVDNAKLISISTWNYDDDEIYVYVSTLPDDFDLSAYPLKIDEGIIDFKEIDWVFNLKNFGVIEDLRVFLNDIKEDQCNNYHLVYNDSKLVEYIKK